jgi:hypothetical protein
MPQPQNALNAASDNGKRSLLQTVRLMSLGRLLAVCLFVGIGIGAGVVGMSSLVKWYARQPLQPIPAKVWPPISLSVGATAQLKTDWNGESRYQLSVSPATAEMGPALKRMLRLADLGPSIPQFAIHFYDKAGFEVCRTDVEATAIQDSGNAVVVLAANGHFHCSRSDYKQLDRWNVDYRFPSLLAGAGQEKTAEAKPVTVKNSSRPMPQITPQAADDTLTGFDRSSGHLEVRSGKTFVIYREGEKDTAEGWQIGADVTHTQPGLHYECDTRNECLIENEENKQAVHGRLLR